MSRFSNLSHRGLMKLACAQNELIMKMITITRFHESTLQRENADNAWDKAVDEYANELKKIKSEDRGVKE